MKKMIVTMGMMGVMGIMGVTAADRAYAAAAIPAGSYQGGGLWKDQNGRTGTYKTQLSLDGSHLVSSYQFEGGSGSAEVKMDLDLQVGAFFDVMMAGQKVGTGYCLDRATVCHYSANVNGMELEETIVQPEAAYIARFGSKVVHGVRVYWQEKLTEGARN